MVGCADTPGWNNFERLGGALTCADYVSKGYCAKGQLLVGWTGGAAFNHPEKNCCSCGRWDREASFWRPPSGKGSRGGRSSSTPPCWDPQLDDPMQPWGSSGFCAAWPNYWRSSTNSSLGHEARSLVHRAALKALSHVSTVQKSDLDAAITPRCAQKLCVLVQIIGGSVYVVAPEGMRRCATGDAGGGAEGAQRPSTDTSKCSSEERSRTPGLSSDWFAPWSPSLLEWHFAAGVNISDCSVKVRPGDYNGPYTRLRFINALRMLEEAARHEEARKGIPDTELVLCLNEVAVNAGDWCLSGPQPVFASTTNVEAPMVPFVHWMPKLRDWDFSVWDDVREAQAREAAEAWPRTRREPPKSAAVFRGGIYRTSVYTANWRSNGTRRTDLTPYNWRDAGRTALLRIKEEDPDAKRLLDVNLAGRELGKWPQKLQVPESAMALLDPPNGMPLRTQMYRFKYALNLEGHGGWADRLYLLLLGPQLVLAQDLPFKTWYEAVLEPGKTHLVLDAALRNLTDSVRWAIGHEAEANAMVRRAQQATEVLTSVGGMRLYVRELLREYTKRLQYTPKRRARAVRFDVSRGGGCRSCVLRPAPEKQECGPRTLCKAAGATEGRETIRSICGARGTFVGWGGRKYYSLHDAWFSLPSSREASMHEDGS